MKVVNFVLYLFLGSTIALQAAAADKSTYLVTSCQELMGIYAKRDQQHLLAGLTTSTAEALRAGYCRGVLDEYRRRSDSCLRNDWYAQASRIASYPADGGEFPTVETLLEYSCGI